MPDVGYLAFAAAGRDYLYDTTTNAVIELPEAAARCVDAFVRHRAEGVRGSGQPTDEFVGEGVEFLEHIRDELKMLQPFPGLSFDWLFAGEDLEDKLDRGLASIALGVTERCNLRCGYCIYSGDYEGERTHQDRSMTWDVARRAVDYFLEHSQPDSARLVALYGGEPLLEWKLVRRTIEYVEAHPQGRGASCTIATNLVSVSDEILDFLVAHDVDVQVSVDGPREDHDRFRVRVGGQGTHGPVLDNLQRILDRSESYFRRCVSISGTFQDDQDITEIVDYFSTGCFRDLPVKISARRAAGSRSYERTEENRKRHQERLDDLLDRFLEEKPDDRRMNPPALSSVLRDVFVRLPSRRLVRARAERWPLGACIPGTTRLFVGADGRLYICEKLGNDAFCIGNVFEGIQPSRVRELLSGFTRACEELCTSCWANRLCSHCFVHTVPAGAAAAEGMDKHCQATRERLSRALRRYAYVLANEPKEARADPASLRGRHVRRSLPRQALADAVRRTEAAGEDVEAR